MLCSTTGGQIERENVVNQLYSGRQSVTLCVFLFCFNQRLLLSSWYAKEDRKWRRVSNLKNP